MTKTIQILYVACAALLLTIVSGCSSSGYSGSSGYYHGNSSYYYRGNSWDYDRYYRSGVNRNYRRAEARGRAHRARRR
ncbi:MAG: hypothetical protein ACN4GW_20920 [Desulforhopalus sp.]